MTTPDTDFIALQRALAGQYSLERELGRGGMGVVYLAREVALNRTVAIKILPPALAANEDLRERFLREARMAAQLSHPHIVPIHRVGAAGDFVFFAMAYIEGETLAERVRARGPLPPAEAVRVLREVAWALAYAHLRGIVHRDVKPDNVLLERATGRALVADFGIAQASGSDASHDARTGAVPAPGGGGTPPLHLTLPGRVMGTAHFMSPEQATGEPVDARSDIYSLGVVAYLALTGRLPFDAPSAAAVIAKHLGERPAPVASVAPGVPRRVAAAVERCLAKDPARRYESAESFADALGEATEALREVPAPIRVWIARTEQEETGRAMLVLMGAFVGGMISIPLGSLTPFLAGTVSTALVSAIPVLLRTRSVLRAGYGIDDLRAGLRDRLLRQSEEIAFETAQQSAVLRHATRVLAIASGAAIFVVPMALGWHGKGPGIAWLASLTTFTLAGVATLRDVVTSRWAARLAAQKLRLWNGPWGERIVRLAGLGLRRGRPAAQLAQRTEIALGRATDHLFRALPKAQQKELRALPDVVRRLERDAESLRESIDRLDEQLAAFEAADPSPALAASLEARPALDAERERLRGELRATRAAAADRLAGTVAALENIRLDLLRLQVGAGSVASVTASLSAAQRMAGEVRLAADAAADVERILRGRDASTPREGATSA